MINRIGLMQGRLSKMNKQRIQEFPVNSWKDEFKKMKKLKINKIEWLIDENFEKNPILIKRKLDEIEYYKKKYNISITAVCCDNFMFTSFFEDQHSFDKLKLIVENSKKLKIKKIDLPLIGKNSIKKSRLKNLFISKMNKMSNFFLKNKVIVTFETDLSPNQSFNFFKKLKNKNIFGITYDMGNSTFWGFDFKKEIALIGKYIKHVHVKDCTKKKYSVPLGTGDTNIQEVLKLLKKKKYRGDFILQTARKTKHHTNEIKNYTTFFENKLRTYFA